MVARTEVVFTMKIMVVFLNKETLWAGYLYKV